MEELIPIFLFICVAAVLILRPVTKRLGLLLEAMARARMGTPIQTESLDSGELARVRGLLEQMGKRFDLLEERLDFTERLLSSTQREARLAARLEAARNDGPALRRESALHEVDLLAR